MLSTRFRDGLQQKQKIILASQSPSRAMILRGAGILFDAIPADINESSIIRESLKKGISPSKIGLLLAGRKAAAISSQENYTDMVVLGADQILVCQGKMFEKPADMNTARETLEKLRGKTHTLIACVSMYFGNKKIFETSDQANLTMRNFSDDFLEGYLKEAGEKILSSVGAYQLEGAGAQLFEKIEGDFFTILGLPLFPILAFLRQQDVLDV